MSELWGVARFFLRSFALETREVGVEYYAVAIKKKRYYAVPAILGHVVWPCLVDSRKIFDKIFFIFKVLNIN